MKKIELHGILAEKFGRYFELKVRTAREATHAIASQLPEFRKWMLTSEQKGLRYAVFVGDKNIGENELDSITDRQTIHIVPKIIGAGGKIGGWLQVIGGAVMVGIGIVTLNPMLVGMGVGMAIGGIASLLMPVPEMPNGDEDGNRANYGFGGAITTTAQGNPVPVLYGERDVGGFICSAGIYAEDEQ